MVRVREGDDMTEGVQLFGLSIGMGVCYTEKAARPALKAPNVALDGLHF